MMTNIKALYLIAVLLFSSELNFSCRHEEPAVCREFHNLSGQQQEKDFPTFPVEKQLEIYRCEMQMKPPASSWAYEIAKGGGKIIPIVLEKLKIEKEETRQNDLIYLFQVMSEEGYLHDRQDVADQIRQVVSKMKYSAIRNQAQEALNQIEKNIRSKE